MKITITRKSDPNDVGIINLSKVAAVHIHPIEGLEVFSELNGTPAKFSDDLYNFHIVKIAGDGKVYQSPATLAQILNAYVKE